MLAHFSPQARFGQRDRYRILVHVKADICDRLRHDPSPIHEAGTDHPAQPSKPAYCETGRPYLRRTSGLVSTIHPFAFGGRATLAASLCT